MINRMAVNPLRVLTIRERQELGRLMIRALRDVCEEQGQLARLGDRFAREIYASDAAGYGALAADLADLLTEDLLAVAAVTA